MMSLWSYMMRGFRVKPGMTYLRHGMTAAVYCVLLLAVLSCSKVEVPDGAGNAIVFAGSTSSHVSSKSLYEPSNINTGGNAIVVNDRFIADDGQTYHYIANEPVTYNAASIGWNSETTYYWPKGGRHEFMAYTTENHAGNMTTLNAAGGSASYDFGNRTLRVPTSGTWTLDLDNQFDFMYASTERSMSEQNPTRTVDLNFKHLFCAVGVKVVNLYRDEVAPETNPSSDYRNYKKNYKLGTLNFTGIADAASASIPFIVGSGTGTPVIDYNEPVLTSLQMSLSNPIALWQKNSVEDAAIAYSGQGNCGTGGYFLMWPQNASLFENIKIYIELTRENCVKINNRKWDWQQETFSTVYKKLSEFPNAPKQWLPGYRYTYIFVLQDDRIYFTVEVVPWIDDDVILEE